MRRTSRAAVLAAALGCLLVSGCAGSSPDDAAAPAATPTTAAPTTAAPTAVPTTTTPTAEPSPDDAQTVSLTVAGGEVSGDTGRVEVPLGEMVRVVVTADVAEEIHVHGFDLHQNTVADQPTTLEFVADRAGVFEIELEESKTLLTRLQVQ